MPTVALAYDPRAGGPETDAALVEALEGAGAAVRTAGWDVDGTWDELAVWADVVVNRTLHLDPGSREELLVWAQTVAEASHLAAPLDVLRWSTHRSFLLELEERGAPVVPTAWMSQGDRIDLGALLRSRGWGRVEVLPAVGPAELAIAAPGVGGCAVAATQGSLDHLLASGDALVRPLPGPTATHLSVVVVDGRTSHVVQHLPEGGQRVEDGEAAALAAWLVEATGVEVPLARAALRRDDLGALELVDLQMAAVDLSLGLVPEAAPVAARALLASVSAGSG